jgi:hypothetical protein
VENHENLNQDSRPPGRDLNSAPPKYEAGVLTTQPRLSVNVNISSIASHCSSVYNHAPRIYRVFHLKRTPNYKSTRKL